MDRMNHDKEPPPSKQQAAILPSQASLNVSLKDIVNDGCATELYVDFNKIGEGYAALTCSYSILSVPLEKSSLLPAPRPDKKSPLSKCQLTTRT